MLFSKFKLCGFLTMSVNFNFKAIYVVLSYTVDNNNFGNTE